MRWQRATLALLVVLTSGYMLVDGARWFLLGDYFTVEGELGPWAPLVSAIGIEPRSSLMAGIFVGYGAAWLASLGSFLAGRASWRVMLAFALGSLWYLVIGTIFSLAQAALILANKRTLGNP